MCNLLLGYFEPKFKKYSLFFLYFPHKVSSNKRFSIRGDFPESKDPFIYIENSKGKGFLYHILGDDKVGGVY